MIFIEVDGALIDVTERSAKMAECLV